MGHVSLASSVLDVAQGEGGERKRGEGRGGLTGALSLPRPTLKVPAQCLPGVRATCQEAVVAVFGAADSVSAGTTSGAIACHGSPTTMASFQREPFFFFPSQ